MLFRSNEMQKGNLDYALVPASDDEIGMLTADFDKMRQRMKEVMEKQVENEAASREMVGNISHDLKTPLTAIKGYTEGLMDGIADTPERRDKYLRTIYMKANDMSHLVDELSDFTKIESDAMVYHFTEINVDRFFMDCIQEYSLDLEEKNVAIGYNNYTNKDLMMQADTEQLRRVINNIIGNSLKYMDKPQGVIELRIRNAEDPDKIEVSIEDNGRGIAKEDCGQIFDRFFRTDASRNSALGGSGLGLSIAKKVIVDHGGEIWADGSPGVGTTITFTLCKSKKEVPAEAAHDKKEKLKRKKFFMK